VSDSSLFTIREWLCLHGVDAGSFAQAQFCSDVSQLAPGQWQYSAWLDAPGRVRAFFHLLRTDEQRFHLLLRGGAAEPLLEPLRRFVFRSKVRIEIGAPDPATLVFADAVSTGGGVFALRREGESICLDQPGDASLLFAGTHSAGDSPIDEAIALREIRAGLPRLPMAAAGELLPAWLDFERLGAISYKKGCYPGQEIAARLYFRGGNNRRLHRLRMTSVGAPSAGAPLRDGSGKEAGRLLQAAVSGSGVHEGLAVLRDNIDHENLQLADAPATRIEVLSTQWAASA
jgi:folate-binding protein YgfZ